MKRYLALVIVFIATVSGAACSSKADLPHAKVVFVSPSGVEGEPFSVEVVSTRAERARGLMFRKELEDRRGMLFVFDQPSVHTFWMKNTFIPLDMVFLSEDQKVVGILEDVPPLTETGRSVDATSKYVLEFLGGTMKRHGVTKGYSVRFIGAVPVGEAEYSG